MRKYQLVVLTLLLASTALAARKHIDFAKHLHVPRTPAQIEADRHLPIHDNTLGDFHPLKIHTDTSGMEAIRNSQPEMYAFMKNKLIPAVVQHMSDTFKVREAASIKVNTAQCAEFTVPSNYKTTATTADLILFFTAEAEKSDGFVAWASPCQLHGTTLRPTVGRVNMNPYHLSTENKKFFDQFATTLHEAYHIMGFSSSLYSYFIDPATMKRKRPEDTHITNGTGAF
jgi:leishmanolysin